MALSSDEDIVRAICSDKVDSASGFISPSLFAGKGDVSVSRLVMRRIEDQWGFFERRVSNPPDRALVLIGEINVGLLERTGLNYAEKPTQLTVDADPDYSIPEDPDLAHAVIPQRITRGLATEIIRALKIHKSS